ncbi:MAG TPA: shikimate kinase [Actinomycetota bacterium]
MERVLLIGMMGSGKTTVGRAVAARTGWPYLDNDELVERSTSRPTPEVLADADEATLRAAERDALDAALAAEPPLVASVAAGVVLDAAARRRMHAGGFVVYLRASLEELSARVGDGSGRPWLGDDPRAALAALGAGREPLYEEAAHLVLDVGGATPEELAERIVDAAAAPDASPTPEDR